LVLFLFGMQKKKRHRYSSFFIILLVKSIMANISKNVKLAIKN